LFPVPEALLSPVSRLVGLGGPGPGGALLKMSKSLNNAILLSDDADTIKAKVMKMYTDPNRVRATDPGTVEGNPLWIFHDTFNPDRDWIEATKEQYRAGSIGDVACKKALVDVLVDLVAPMAKRRAAFADDVPYVQQCLREGAARVNARLDRLIVQVKEAMRQVF
jgi:tryptophanyl-tRNA synthetase